MITITSTAITIAPELIAGEIVPVSIDATGMDLPDAPRLYLAARAYPGPGWLLGACELAHGEGAAWTGSLNLATHAAARWYFGAGADESRRILLELVEESTRDSLLRLATTLRNSALLCCADASPAPLTPGVTLADVDAEIDAALAALSIPAPSDEPPLAPGTPAPGVSPDYARADHVHPAAATGLLPLVSVQVAEGVVAPLPGRLALAIAPEGATTVQIGRPAETGDCRLAAVQVRAISNPLRVWGGSPSSSDSPYVDLPAWGACVAFGACINEDFDIWLLTRFPVPRP